MAHAHDILISVRHDHALNMLNGTKTAELRRRVLRIRPGTRIWVYSKLPRGRVELVAVVEEIILAPPRRLWDLYRSRIAVTQAEFRSYLKGVNAACVVLLRDVQPLQPTLELAAIRRVSRGFHPPQFFKQLVPHGPELKSLISSAARGARPRSAP